MISSLFKLLPCAALTGALLLAPTADAAGRQRVNLPPSADLTYAIKAKQKGIPVEGEAVVHWSAAPNHFSASNEVRAALVGKILDVRSEGGVDVHGLAPGTFTQKRFRKDATTTTFDRATNTIRFTASDRTYPIKGGEQDRNSAIWQLISLARAMPAQFKPGSQWSFVVAGDRDADPWTFKVRNREKISTPLGEFNTVHIFRAPPPDSKDQQLDIWLAPSLEWYPARLRFTDDSGDYIEQTLRKVSRKTP